jgi:endonuclease YncB( thermonuclease family)
MFFKALEKEIEKASSPEGEEAKKEKKGFWSRLVN